MKKSIGCLHRRIVWARNMLLDVDLFAKAEIEMLHHLTKRGCEIFLISGYAKQRYKFRNPKIHLFSIPAGRNSIPLKLHFIFATVQFFYFPIYLLKVKPNFVIVDWDSLFSLILILPFYRLMGIKFVLDIRTTMTPIRNLYQKVGLRQYLLDLAFSASVCLAKKKMDGMTIITDMMKKEICDKFRIDPNWVGVWSSGVPAEPFSYEDHVKDGIELRENLGLTNSFVIFYHGAFSQFRGTMNAINAMSVIKDEYPHVVLFLLGTGPIQTVDEMRRAIQHKELQEKVIIHDAVDYAEVPKYIAMCDVGIIPFLDLPFTRNQCPLKLLEYLAMKKSVILTDIPCTREVVGNEKCGIYLSSTSIAGIAKSIGFAYNNKEKLKEWGAKGRVIVESKYTWEKIAENLEHYLRVIENK